MDDGEGKDQQQRKSEKNKYIFILWVLGMEMYFKKSVS